MTPGNVLVGFSRRLREEGIPVGPLHTGTLVDALGTVGAGQPDDVYWAFRSASITARDQVPIFDRVFMEIFGGLPAEPPLTVVMAIPRTWAISLPEEPGEGGSDPADDMSSATGASLVERLADRDFSELTALEEAQVRSLIAQMVWKPAEAKSRRRVAAKAGDRPDLRRTLRHTIGWEGDLMKIATTRRATRRRPLIFIADVSGSMERYSEMLLYFAHSAQDRLGRLEAFVFSTRLTRITRELDRRRPSEAIGRVSQAVHDWSGGTRIGESLRTFNRDWSRRVVRGGPIALIVSDGWDRGDPDLLAAEMAHLHRIMHRVIWLNPLAGRQGYAPETRGMVAALPHIDDLLAAGTLRDLKTLVGLLEDLV